VEVDEMLTFYIRRVLIPEARRLAQAGRDKLLGGLRRIDEEAEEASEAAYRDYLSQPGEGDSGGGVDDAQGAGQELYNTLSNLRQSTLNLLAATMFHLQEQRRQTYTQRAERAGLTPVAFETLPSWAKVNELQLVANVTKHAAGRSEEALRVIRPDLFVDPVLARLAPGLPPGSLAPLAGEGLYITEKDLEDYEAAVAQLWEEVAQAHERARGGKG
jgi:hypothetical protein